VFKFGRNIKADFTRLHKQFPNLGETTNIIDILAMCHDRNLLDRSQPSTLDSIASQVTKLLLPKDAAPRRSSDWEHHTLPSTHAAYAALDVYVLYCIYREAYKNAIVDRVNAATPGGTAVTLMSADGTQAIAIGSISLTQPRVLHHIHVKTSTNSRVVVDIDHVFIPEAGLLLYIPSKPAGKLAGLTEKQRRAATQTLGEFGSTPFQIVAPFISLILGHLLDPPTLTNSIQLETTIHQLEAESNARTLDSNPDSDENFEAPHVTSSLDIETEDYHSAGVTEDSELQSLEEFIRYACSIF
jgi:hypothetical protein